MFNRILQFRFNHFVSLIILSLSSGIHSGLTKFAFTLWLKSCGVSIIHLALFSLTFLPYSLKMFWLPVLEHLKLANICKQILKKLFPYSQKKQLKFGHRKCWLLLLGTIIALFIASFCFIDPQSVSIYYLICYVGIFCAFSATNEAMVIAYQMETIKRENLGRLEGRINASYQFGFWLGGTLLFTLSNYFAWKYLFAGVAIFLAFSLLLTLFIQDSITHVKKVQTLKQVFLEPYKDLIKRNKHMIVPLVAFMTLYRMQDRLLIGVTNYFFIDLGFSQHFLFGKTLGIIAAILGGLLGSWCVKKCGYKKALMIGMLGHIAASLLLLLQSAVFQKSHILFYMIMFGEKFTRGFEATIFYTYQMIFCSKYFVIAQYSMLIALDRLSGTLVGAMSGHIINALGWSFFFIFSFFGTLPSLWFLRKLPDGKKQNKETK